ncbi:MAG: beta-L-arabinofuranosidase domain-containing protein [Bacteroidaceae bacterium]
MNTTKLIICSLLITGGLSFTQAQTTTPPRSIQSAEPIEVECHEGCAPSLPYVIRVNYTDGQRALRQVRWTNEALAEEQAEADPALHPAGSSYRIGGYVIGDETTADGFPVEALIHVTAKEPPVPKRRKAQPFPLGDVVLNGNNRLTRNRDEAIREICSWDITQQLYNYRDTYGLPTEGYTTSDGWDAPDCKLKGHGSGHYMSAIAQAYAVATNPAQKDTLRARIVRMVDELRQCQERTFVYADSLKHFRQACDLAPEAELQAMKGTWADFDHYKKQFQEYGYGYLNAIPAQHCVLIEKYSPYNNSDWVWAPYYSVHKQLAGLIDIATYFDDKKTARKALRIATDMGLWVWNRMHYRTFMQSHGDTKQRRQGPGNRYEMWDMYIAGEVGGISESLARLAAMATDKTEREHLLQASNYFDAPRFFDPLARNIDDIRTRHANQHIPMIIGALRSYEGNRNPYYYRLAENFWTHIQARYAYATGGVGNGEMFRQPYTQMLSMATNGMKADGTDANPDINETCCAYNLLKLTRDLNCYNPDDPRYMDYYERTLYNQIIGSLNPERYQTCYQYAVGLNATKPFGNETPQSTCCGGTGSENHTKYQEAAYFANAQTLYVALYLPTTLRWKEKGITIRQDCEWPAEHTRIEVTQGKARFTMKLRVPYWATQGFEVKVNGRVYASGCQPSGYLELQRKWKAGDVVEVDMPFGKHIHYGPDKLAGELAGTTDEPLDDAWLGTLMLGPLAMTGTNAVTWSDATLHIDSHLSNIQPHRPSASASPHEEKLYSLSVDGQEFLPDYYRNVHSTHYYRIVHTDAPTDAAAQKPLTDKSGLQALIKAAEERLGQPEAWAPHGMERMAKALDNARMVEQATTPLTQKQANRVAALLNKALTLMRPSNLAESEDLEPLIRLIGQAEKQPSTALLKEAIDHGHMVVKYVTDGSGTHDMIRTAMEKLAGAMEQ